MQVDYSPGKVLFIGKHNILFRIPPRDTNIETFLKHDRNVCPGNGTETDCCIRVLKSVYRNPKSFRFEKIKTKSPARVFWKENKRKFGDGRQSGEKKIGPRTSLHLCRCLVPKPSSPNPLNSKIRSECPRINRSGMRTYVTRRTARRRPPPSGLR